MPVPWLSAIKAIPWGTVVEHAPKVLGKARDLIDRQRSNHKINVSPLVATVAKETSQV